MAYFQDTDPTKEAHEYRCPVVKVVAKPGVVDTVAEFLKAALELANAEPGTSVWFALRTDSATFWIVDAFPAT